MNRSWSSIALAAVGILVALGCSSAPEGKAERAIGSDGKVAVPDLVGDTMDTVYDQLQDVGLVASAETMIGVSNWTNEAVVLSITPRAGVRVAPASTVKILEATKGEIRFFARPMPNLVGIDWLDAASGNLEAAYFYMDATWRKPKGREKPGTIVGQTPKAGAKLKMGQKIRVTVADFTSGKSSGRSSDVDVPNINWPNVCRRTKWC